MGLPIATGPHSFRVNAIDLHVGKRMSFELSPEFMRVYLAPGGCGNSLARLYTNLQHHYNSQIEAVDGSEQPAFSDKMPPSNLNLALMNLFVGMCKGLAGLPRDFRNLQYVDKWIELRFANTDQEQVAPELIVSSRRLNHTILFEWKSGPNLEADQLRRYSRVTQDDLSERAALAIEETGSHDVAVVPICKNTRNG